MFLYSVPELIELLEYHGLLPQGPKAFWTVFLEADLKVRHAFERYVQLLD